MESEKMCFAVLGGDERQLWLARGLEKEFEVRTLDVPGTEKSISVEQVLQKAGAVILPMPAFDEEDCVTGVRKRLHLNEILKRLEPGAVVYGGKLTAHQTEILENEGHPTVDYGSLEQLATANAVPTAEGAILIALRELPITLWESRCLVLGFGRVGKALALRLKALGAKVTATARKPGDLALIRTMGMKNAVTGPEVLGSEPWDLVVNTVPARLLDGESLKLLPKQTLILDLASKPGGVDRKAAAAQGRQVIWALGLPGKTAAKTAGNLVKEAILEHWKAGKGRIT